MYIVMISSECAPVAKVGGLADVVYGLSRELEIRGNVVEIILPKYDCMRYDHIWDLQMAYQDLWVPWYGGAIHCSVWFGHVHGRRCFFIDPHSQDNFFNRGIFYGASDEAMRLSFLARRPWSLCCKPINVLMLSIAMIGKQDLFRSCYTRCTNLPECRINGCAIRSITLNIRV